MTLQASGTISLMQVNQELGRGAFSTISLNVFNAGGADVVQTGTGNVTINQCSPSRPNGSAPTSMNEWYSYNHNASCGDPYPCSENSGIVVVGTGGNSNILWDNAGKPFDTYQQAYDSAINGVGGVFNFYGIWYPNGTASPDWPNDTVWINGYIVRNLFPNYDTDPRLMGKRCGYVYQRIGTSSFVFKIHALDRVGKIIATTTVP